MSDYFTNVNSKPSIKSHEIFNREGARFDLLLNYVRESRRSRLTQEDLEAIDSMFARWCDLLFCGYNVAVTGPQSKHWLLETFKARYLDSGLIPDERPSNGDSSSSSMLKIKTFRLHGFTPMRMQEFAHSLFDIKESRRVTNNDLEEFIEDTRKNKIHHVFMLHSFEHLLRECDDICEIIFQLYSLDDYYIHIILSSDHHNGGKKLSALKFKLQLIFFPTSYGCSFFYEKTQATLEMEDGKAISHNKNSTLQKLFDGTVGIQSLKGIYEALVQTRPIMVYILKDYVEKCKLSKEGDADFDGDDDNDDAISRRRRRTTRTMPDDNSAKQTRKSLHRPTTSTHLDFQQLLKYCEDNFILRRSTNLRNHLGELKDHNIIEEDGNKITCKIDAGTCMKFLEYVNSLGDELV